MMNECAHPLFRFLDCEEEGRECELIICTECGADVPEDRDPLAEGTLLY